MSTQRDLDPFFRQLDIVPAGRWPISYDLRERAIRAVANGGLLSFISEHAEAERERSLPYLRELLDLANDADESTVEKSLCKARAVHLGLAETASWGTVYETEKQRRCGLTMSDLRRMRDQRNGTYQPLVNGEW